MLKSYIVNNILFTPLIIVSLSLFTIPKIKERYLATTRYYIWNIICLALLIPPNIYSYLFKPRINIFPQNRDNIIIQTFKEIDQILMPTTETVAYVDYNLKASNFSGKQIFYTIWLSAALIYFLFQIISYYYFRYKSLHLSIEITDKTILSILENLKKEQKIKTKIQLRYSYFVTSPLIIGCFHPIILLPYKLKNEYLHYIFKHELYHYKCFDLVLQHIRLITQSLYLFNPFVWILCNKANKDMETACDFHVLNFSNERERKKYADAIFHIASLSMNKNQTLTPSFAQTKSDIFYRMEDIMNNKSKKRGTFLLVATILSIVSINILSVYSNLIPQKGQKSKIDSAYIPLEETFENLGYRVNESNENLIKLTNGDKTLNFINETNYNLKKNSNTYYANAEGETFFIKIGVLKDLGYQVKEDNGFYLIDNNREIKLNTEALLKHLTKITYLDEAKLDSPTEIMFSNHKIVAQSISPENLKGYTIETNNLMGYNLKELEDYIKANYMVTLEQYKDNLISIDTKYPNSIRVTYDLLDNGQVLANIVDSDGKTYIELGMEVRAKTVFVDK